MCVHACTPVCVCSCADVCFDCFVLCFVMGNVLQFGETAHKRVYYYVCFGYSNRSLIQIDFPEIKVGPFCRCLIMRNIMGGDQNCIQ